MDTPFFQKRFVILAGKGGVGKSTLTAAIGLAAARRGLRTLVAELDTTEKVPLLFGKPPSGHRIQPIHDGLWSINIQPEPALEEYGLMKLRYKTAYKVVFENDFMRKLLRLLPGMNELLLIGKAWFEEDRKDHHGRPYWDMIVVDAPATGHGISLFRLPHVILSVISSGPMADDTRKIRDLLLDPRRTSFNIVTLPEEMPYAETLDLLEQNRHVLRIPPGYLFVNQVWPRLLDEPEWDVLRAYRASRHQPELKMARVLECIRYMQDRRTMQEDYLSRLRQHAGLPSVEIPYLFTESFGLEATQRIADWVEQRIEAHHTAHPLD